MMTAMRIDTPFPKPGTVREVADGIWWIRLQLDSSLEHVNVYLLADNAGYVLVDTGTNEGACFAQLQSALTQCNCSIERLSKLIVTHHHPDHIGLAGRLRRDLMLWCTRTCWLSTALLTSLAPDPDAAALEFYQRAGMPEVEIQAFARRQPNARYSRLVAKPPLMYQRIKEADTLQIGDRQWTVHIGNGHAAEHATLWSDDGLTIVGDQILANISPSLHVHTSEPNADTVGEWLESCQRFADLADDNTLALPGHGEPFQGVSERCRGMARNQATVLNRLRESLSRPRKTVDCLELIGPTMGTFGAREHAFLLTTAYLNHLWSQGELRRELVGNTYLWIRA